MFELVLHIASHERRLTISSLDRTSGEVDAVRIPKDGWYAHQVMWDNWVDVERAAIHIIGHWNYNDTTSKDVYVVSTADEVELKLNGNSLGRGVQSHRFLFTFSAIQWESGELEAIGYSAGSVDVVATDKRVTTGEPAAIRLTTHTSPTGFHASGADIALVDVEVVDSNGVRCPTALNLIDFTLSGEATWRGGIAVGENNYILSTELPVENGVNRVLLRSTTVPGKVSLSASSDGLSSASIDLDTVGSHSTFGLSRELPADGLPSNLSRGPTPSGTPYTAERISVDILSVSAGSNADTAELAIDDNEGTTWVSSSNIDNAWISFQLAQESNVNAVLLKLASFRTTTYNVKVSVDNTTVWSNTTSTSLGYATLAFNATKGATVTVSSTGGALKITEAEIYAPA